MKSSLSSTLVRLMCAGALVSVVSSASAATINVPADYPTIAAAVAACSEGDTINVAAGTYNEATAPTFTTASVTMNGIGSVTIAPASSLNAGVIVWTNNLVMNNIKVVRATSDQTWMRSVEMGQDASATFTNCEFEGPGNGVGLILFHGADATVQGCRFANFNAAATWASAIFMEGSLGGYCNVTVENTTFDTGCNGWLRTFSSNSAKVGNITVRNCVCKASNGVHALEFIGAALKYDPAANFLFERCTFEGTNLEVAEFHYADPGPASFLMKQCEFKKYDSLRREVYFDMKTTATFENVAFLGGKHETVMRIWGGPYNCSFKYCTIANDGITAAEGASGVDSSTLIDGWDAGRTFPIVDSLLYSPTNYSPALAGDAGSASDRIYDVTYSVIDHGLPIAGTKVIVNGGTGYSNAPINFVNPAAGNYQLGAGSPAINTATDIGIAVDALNNPRPVGPGFDMGAYESQTAQVGDWTMY